MKTLQHAKRNAFTLVEILIVIAIIAILAALTVTAASKVIDTQRQSNTENLLRTLDKVLQQQVHAVVAKADEERIPPGVMLMADNDQRRAKVIWRKLRLKQEFPMTFDEARAPHLAAQTPTPFVSAADLKPIPSYVSALAGVTGGTREQEMAICLLLALQQNRGGVSLNPESLPSSNVTTVTLGVPLKMLVDSWETPLAFFRFPTGNLDMLRNPPPSAALMKGKTNGQPRQGFLHPNPNLELPTSTPALAGTKGAQFPDPLDPDGTLVSPAWNKVANYTTGTRPVFWFERLCHPIRSGTGGVTGGGQIPYQTKQVYMIPVIASAGYNRRFGLDMVASPPGPIVFPAALNVTSYLMSVDLWNLDSDIPEIAARPSIAKRESNDNIYSFRLRVGARGD